MIRFLLRCMVWSLGLHWGSSEASSGFGESHLIPQRERNGFERIVTALSSALLLLSAVNVFMEYESWAFLYARDSVFLTIPALLWAGQRVARPSLPMDREAIAVGLWSFGPYIPLFLLGGVNLIPLIPLVWQLGGVFLLVVITMIRDISRERS